VGPVEEEEEETGIASDVVKVEGEDPATPGCLRKDRVIRRVGDSKSWVRTPLPRLRGNPGTKQHALVETILRNNLLPA